MKTYRRKLGAIILTVLIYLIMSFSVCMGQEKEIELTASVDADKIGLDDILYFTVMVRGKDLSDVPVPTLPAIEGFSILGSSRSSAQEIQIIGSKAESSISYSYVYSLKPQKKGTFTLPSVKIVYKNISYSTSPIKIEVKDGSIKKTSPQRRRSLMDDFFNDRSDDDFGLSRSRFREQKEITDEIILERTPATAEIFTGEQMVLYTYLYATDVDIFNLVPSNDPALEGFWIEETTLNPQETRTQVQRGGKLYTRFTLRRQVLFPTKAGDFSIPSMTLDMTIRRIGFGAVGFSQKVTRKSNVVKVKVTPLPRETMPSEFTGAVGDFNIEAKLDKTQAATGEAVNLIVTYKGTGNMKDIRPPALKDSTDYTLYGPEQTQDIGLRGSVWGGEKTWKYIIVPKTPGETVIGPFTTVYFDPVSKKYITKNTEQLRLTVKEGTGTAALPNYIGQSPELRQNDINYIRNTEGKIRDESKFLLEKPVTWILFALPVVTNLGFFLFGFIQARRRVNVVSFRFRRAETEALKALREAGHCAQKKEFQKSYDMLIKAFAGYFADKWNMAAGSLTLEQVRKKLESIDTETSKKVIGYLEECEYCRFAGSKNDDKKKIDEMLETGKDLLNELERMLK